ncbi:hypothetical protein ABZU32_28885 [Sphaerisporangium sp. NPDC005288]|uniref:hypothetical protein n=1 Tax=Sphaerisporangium sp. NPDC005288 TaxID=3155114 RepID=UPI0033B01CD8
MISDSHRPILTAPLMVAIPLGVISDVFPPAGRAAQLGLLFSDRVQAGDHVVQAAGDAVGAFERQDRFEAAEPVAGDGQAGPGPLGELAGGRMQVGARMIGQP